MLGIDSPQTKTTPCLYPLGYDSLLTTQKKKKPKCGAEKCVTMRFNPEVAFKVPTVIQRLSV